MNWLLLNQFYAILGPLNFNVFVLEEVLSSELQLVQVLVSGPISFKTMISRPLSQTWYNQIGLADQEVVT